MTHRTTITLDDEIFAFLNHVAGDNRSAYINELLRQERNNSLKQALLKANQEEAEDTDYQEELQSWESTHPMALSMAEFKQLDIHWIDLEPAKIAETKKPRPCVIVQGDLVNIQSRTLIVAPLLPNHKPWPFAVNLEPSQENGLDKNRHINLKEALIKLIRASSETTTN